MALHPSHQTFTRYILAGDIGGTNCRLQLVSISTGPGIGGRRLSADISSMPQAFGGGEVVKKDAAAIVATKVYPNEEWDTLTHIIKDFIAINNNVKISAACLAVAGPVKNDQCTLTNVLWRKEAAIDGRILERDLGIPRVRLINDFVANGYGLPILGDDDFRTLQEAEGQMYGPICCLGAGTGLGMVYLTWDGQDYEVHASEGGHSEFGPRDEEQDRLLKFVRKELDGGHVSVERLVSGPGIRTIYQFYQTEYPDKISASVTKEMEETDQSKVITTHALEGTDFLCEKALEMFIKIYAAEAGNKALTLVPGGGFYIAGGIAPKILPALIKDDLFMRNYLDKGRLSHVIANIPVHVVVHPDLGLLGAKALAFRLLRDIGQGPSVMSTINSASDMGGNPMSPIQRQGSTTAVHG